MFVVVIFILSAAVIALDYLAYKRYLRNAKAWVKWFVGALLIL